MMLPATALWPGITILMMLLFAKMHAEMNGVDMFESLQAGIKYFQGYCV